MTELNAGSPFLGTMALAGLPSMGRPATPWVARHVLATRTSMDGVLHEPEPARLATVQVKEFIAARRKASFTRSDLFKGSAVIRHSSNGSKLEIPSQSFQTLSLGS